MYSDSYYNSSCRQPQQKSTNYLDLIKGGGRVTTRSPNKLHFNDHGSTKKNVNEKENVHKQTKKQECSKKSGVSYNSDNNSQYKENGKNRLSEESNSLSDLDIKYLTNTRQKVQSRKNIMELKNQMSPVYFNRDAERFSYLEYQDPLIGNQFYQHNNNIPQAQYQRYKQNYQEQNGYANKFLPVPQSVSQAYNNHNNQYNNNQRKDISSINDYIKQNQLQQTTNSSWSSIRQDNKNSFLSDQSEYITERREDSFGNIELVRRRVEPSKNMGTPNLPQPPKATDPDLQRYTRNDRNTPISTAYQNEESNNAGRYLSRQFRLLPRINVTTIIFVILAIYVVSKNMSKFMNGESFLNNLTQSLKIFNNQTNKQQQQPSPNKIIQNKQQDIYLTEGDKRENYISDNIIGNINEQMNLDNDSHLAKKFAKDLILELTDILKQKGKMYRSDYEESLNKRFMTPMLREILPELNKLLLNSKHIRILYDVINRKEYYELYPQNEKN